MPEHSTAIATMAAQARSLGAELGGASDVVFGALGWQARIGFRDGLEATYRWFLEQPDLRR